MKGITRSPLLMPSFGSLTANRTLRLVYGVYDVEFILPANRVQVRTPVRSLDINYSVTNAAIIDNGLKIAAGEDRYQWDVANTRLSETQWNMLRRLHRNWQANVPTPIVLHDRSTEFVEDGTQTRPEALNPPSAPSSDATTTVYWARFNVGFSQPPVIEEIALDNCNAGTRAYIVSFQLRELDKLTL